MDTLPLPPRPDLGQYRKRAKDLVAAANSGDEHGLGAWGADLRETIARLTDVPRTPFVDESLDRAVASIQEGVREKTGRTGTRLVLADAQFLLARAHGFTNWAAFAGHVRAMSSETDPFEAAADAVVGGDLAALRSRLRADPDLIQARSARVHRAMLLHYVAANGVEDFRQKTPANAVAIARALLEAGAAVDAPAETYEGGANQTTMNLLVSSAHPAEAGLQPALVETLLDFGAAVDGPANDGSPLMTALAFGYPEAAHTLVRRGARIDNVLAAAALGRVELVARFVAEGGEVAPSLVSFDWLGLTGDPRAQVERAFVWACTYGRAAVVEYLLDQGIDPAVVDDDRMTGLHWAAAHKHLEVVELLTRRRAPLEARNRWGGTVLDSTVFFALQRPANAASYSPVLQSLIDAGADVRVVEYPTGNAVVDALLRP